MHPSGADLITISGDMIGLGLKQVKFIGISW